MNISQLLDALKDTSITLSIGEKLLAGVSVSLLSMSVVIIVLTLISIIINLLQKGEEKSSQINVEEVGSCIEKSLDLNTVSSVEKDMELVSVITSAIAATTGSSIDDLIVRKITRNNNSQSTWEMMGKNFSK